MERRQWNGGEQRGEDRSSWRGRGQVRQAPAWSGRQVERQQAPQQVQQQQVQREWRGRPQQDGGVQANRSWGDRNWSERNRTYTDQTRNRSYQTDRRVTENRRWDDNRRWNDNTSRRSYDDNRRWDSNNRRWDNNRRGYSNDYRRWDNGWRGNNRYDWYAYRSHNRDVFRMGYYRSPYRDWSYRRLGVGFFLDSLFYADSYWIGDPWRYRLPEVYGPYRWVRYYDDVLLVDTYSGEVVDVIYDFFW